MFHRSTRHSTFAALGVLAFSLCVLPRPAAAQTSAPQTFRIFLRGVAIGSEEVTLLETPDGWTLRGSGRMGLPVDLTVGYWEARYDRSWKPKELMVDFSAQSQKWNIHTIIEGTSATSDVTQGGQTSRQTDTVAADTLVLPNLIFGAYEALAARLASSGPGSQIRAFIAPQADVVVAVGRITDETIQVPGRKIAARRWALTFGNPGAPLDVEVWTEGSRLLRVDVPTQSLNIIRDDIASVSARLVTLSRPNDEQVPIPADGFSVAATISKPVSAAGTAPGARLPAVILVSGIGGTDRDELLAGIPIFAQLASALADAGFLVVRYDKRGVGQSGGRADAATLDDFAADARMVVTYVSKRKDVDAKRIAVVGYGEGGWVTLRVASRETRVFAFALVGTAATSGADLIMEQQHHALEQGTLSGTGQQQAVEQQKQIIQAVISGMGWETISPDVRRRVDTPLYRSFLVFDPVRVLAATRQPVLVVHTDLDREILPYHGEQLAQLARSRPKAGPTDFVHIPGLNHLLARATTGETGEYGRLAERVVSPEAIVEISRWLRKVLAPPERKP